MPIVMTSTERRIRALSSRRWSARAIRPSSPEATAGVRKSRTTPAALILGPRGGGSEASTVVGCSWDVPEVVQERPGSALGVAGLLARLAGRGRLVGTRLIDALAVDLTLLRSLLAVVLVVVVHEALGLGLEDPQRAAAPPGQLGQLLGTEEQHENQQDEDDLRSADVHV